MNEEVLRTSVGKASKFRALSWPLELFDANEDFKKSRLPFGDDVNRTRYPSRAMRYWWAVSAIQEEARRLDAPTTIVDIACERGILKRMAPEIPGSRWIGLDWKLEKRLLESAGYDETHYCNLEECIPLPDACADIVVSLHTLEHIANHENAFKEFVRILKPQGILLIGTPIIPHTFAAIRERQYSRQFTEGSRVPGAHIHKFSPAMYRKLLDHFGLQLEFMAGLRFLRWSGFVLENSRAWVRLNQLWGALFPSLGREIAIQCRLSKTLQHKEGKLGCPFQQS
jgi:SAM-dependent methyltransferase